MDVETFTSATEVCLTVNECLAHPDAEETQAAGPIWQHTWTGQW